MYVLGNFQSLDSLFQTNYKHYDILNTKGEVVEKNHLKTSPDTILVQGTLSSGAAASVTFCTTAGPTIDGVGFRWLITGTDGEIEVTAPEAQWQMAKIGSPGFSLRARIGKGSEVKTIEIEEGLEEAQAVKDLSHPGPNTARIYEAYFNGDEGSYATFENALETQKLLDWIKEVAKK